MASSQPYGDTPVGVIGNDDYGPAIAARLAACGYRVLYGGLPGSPAVTRGQRLEPASTPTDVAFECSLVLVAVDDTEAMRNLLVGTPDRMGMGAEMEPGSVIVDIGARQATVGLDVGPVRSEHSVAQCVEADAMLRDEVAVDGVAFEHDLRKTGEQGEIATDAWLEVARGDLGLRAEQHI